MGAKFSSVGQNINSAGAGSADAPTVSCGEQSFSENARDSGSEEQMDLMGLDFLRRSSTAGPRRLASSLLDAENAEQSGSESEGVASGGSSLPMMGSTLMMDFPFSMRRIMLSAQSLPSGVWYIDDVHCPVCDASLPYHEIESHLTVCLSRPRWQYNDETLAENKGECVICLEDMDEGQVIARLPCLCIYHKKCIELWFRNKNACPTHPDS